LSSIASKSLLRASATTTSDEAALIGPDGPRVEGSEGDFLFVQGWIGSISIAYDRNLAFDHVT
jgi:hypothetical protein